MLQANLSKMLLLLLQTPEPFFFFLQVIDGAVGGASTNVGAAHQATVTTVDQTQIITLQVDK